MTSAARIEANRLNAQKSTGPKSKEGKERSRQNALRHGLRAEVLELPGEVELIQARIARWSVALPPANDVEEWLVARAAAASVRLDRCTDMEAARIDERVRKVRAKFLDGRRAEAEQLAAFFGDAEATARLRATAIGCDVLLGLLDELEARFAAPGGWGIEGPLELGHLLNIPTDTKSPHPQLIALAEDDRRAEAGDPVARQRLRERLAHCRAELESRCEELWEEVDGPALRAAMHRARFDTSRLAAKLQRYETAHSAELHRCLRQLKARPAAPNEPNDRAQLSTSPGLEPAGRGLAFEPPGAEAAASGASPARPQPPENASSIHDPSLQNPSSLHPSSAAPNEPNAKAQPSRKPKASVPMEWRTRLAVNPAISRAWPVVKGTSITASEIGGRLTPPNAMTREQLVAHYEGRITLEDIEAACEFLNDRGGIGHYED